MYKYIIQIFLTLFFVSCGVDTNPDTDSKSRTGYLLDANVSGVECYCDEKYIGITNTDGSFKFDYSCNYLRFKIGSITLASMPNSYYRNINDNIFFITDITSRNTRNDTNNSSVKNITRLLQTLDNDENPQNGIQINQTVRSNITNILGYEIMHSNINEIDLNNVIIDSGYVNRVLISSTKALTHFEQTLRDHNISVDTVPPYKAYLKENILATSRDTTTITINGEKNSKIFLNGIDTNITLNQDGTNNNFELNTSYFKNTFKEFNISLQDITNKISETLTLRILKDTDDIDAYIFPNAVTINSPSKFIYNLNVTDNSTSYGLDLIYTITGTNKHLFDINTSNGHISFKNDSIASTSHVINIEVSDHANHRIDSNITINVN